MWRTAELASAFLIAAGPGALAQQAGDALAGATLARQVCAVCHALPNESRSPRADAPTFPVIARTPGLTALALTVALQSSHRKMPDLVLSQQEINDVSAFILSLRSAN
jgi:mono/diheme cytochrome c family protein